STRAGWWRPRWRWRRPADGGDGGQQRQVPPRHLPERAERVQQRELQRVCRQPAVALLRHRDLGRSCAASRDRAQSRGLDLAASAVFNPFLSGGHQVTTIFIGFVSGPLTSLLTRNDCPSAATSKSMM